MPRKKFPYWLRKKFIQNDKVDRLRSLLNKSELNTVCQSAKCPNLCECFDRGRATFLILGDTCTRNCRFCAIKKGSPYKPDGKEPGRIAKLIEKMGLNHIVITSVTRDDLIDGGAGQFADCIEKIRKIVPKIRIEVLTPDFKGRKKSLKKILDKKPDIFAHNIETVPRLYKKLRPEADYKRSLGLLKEADACLTVKSGFMVGLGENPEEIKNLMHDLKRSGVETLTIGQYLRPSETQAEVHEFIHPREFDSYKKEAISIGFKKVASQPFMRSSYFN